MESKKLDLESLLVDPSELRKQVKVRPILKKEEIIGQKRAITGMERFVQLDDAEKRYHCFVQVASLRDVESITSYLNSNCDLETTPPDRLCIFGIEDEKPKEQYFTLPAGEGQVLKDEISDILTDIFLDTMVSKYYFSYQEFIDNEKKKIPEELEKMIRNFCLPNAEKLGFSFDIAPLVELALQTDLPKREGFEFKVFFPDADEEKSQVLLKEKLEDPKFNDSYQKIKEELFTIIEAHALFSQNSQQNALLSALEQTKRSFDEYLDKNIRSRLKKGSLGMNAVEQHLAITENLILTFVKNLAQGVHTPEQRERIQMHLEERLKINLLVSNTENSGQPVRVSETGKWTEIFGIDEDYGHAYIVSSPSTSLDHTALKAGLLLKADGGYLVADAMELIRNHAFFELLNDLYLEKTKVGKQPYFFIERDREREDLPIATRVVLYGDMYLFYALTEYVPKFRELFRNSAQFVSRQDLQETVDHYAGFIRRYGFENDQILRPDNSAIEAIIEEGIRAAGDQKKIFSDPNFFRDLINYANLEAKKRDSKSISRQDVEKAVETSKYIGGAMNDLYRDAIVNDKIKIEVDGSRVGQINGLVITGGVEIFGKPGRITVQYSPGTKGVSSIEDLVGRSGPSYQKSVKVLTNILAGKISEANLPLVLNASISFEQSYSDIDGDSATVAQYVALISAITGYEIKQGLAITGSADQFGNVQGIGGVNEKIEGYHQICQKKGKNFGKSGEYGVIIPESNKSNLMLRREIVEDVKKRNFSVYAISHVDQALEAMLDKPCEEIYQRVAEVVEQDIELLKEIRTEKSTEIKFTPDQGGEDDCASLSGLLKNPTRLAEIANNLGVDSKLAPELRLAVAYAIYASSRNKDGGFPF